MNVYWLGIIVRNSPCTLTLQNPVETPYDLVGLRFSCTPGFKDYALVLGGKPVITPIPEVYTALERGLVDGDVTTPITVLVMNFYEVVKYWIDHPFSDGGREMLLVNLDVWNQLPKHLQDVMIETMSEIESGAAAFYGEKVTAAKQVFMDAGMQPITFSPADAKWYVDTLDSAIWKKVEKELSPEMYNKLRDMLTK